MTFSSAPEGVGMASNKIAGAIDVRKERYVVLVLCVCNIGSPLIGIRFVWSGDDMPVFDKYNVKVLKDHHFFGCVIFGVVRCIFFECPLSRLSF